MDIPNLQDKLILQFQTSQVQVIKKLKFQNLIYQPGDNIRIRSDINSKQDLYAKILIIIQAKNITFFPLIYVAWYQHSDNQVISSLAPEDLSTKQLILTQQKDWQYIEAVKGKIEVINEKQFMRMDPKQQQKQYLYFCRSYFTNSKQLVIDSKRQCFCQKYYKPENPWIMCQICKVLYHPSCSNGRDQRCIRCSY